MHPIKQKRLQKGLSQEALEQATKISASHISRLERCEHFPSMRTLRKLAHALGCTVQDLILTDAEEIAICESAKHETQQRVRTSNAKLVNL